MANAAQRRLLDIQRRIYRSLLQTTDQALGEMPEAIVRYEREYNREIRQTLTSGGNKAVTKNELIKAVRAADVTFVADFHTFRQAQRTALRLMRDAYQPGENWVVGIELIASRFQAVLDAFQAGEMSVETFHQTVNYREEWGFPWSNYAPIFDWAREKGVKLIALNRPRELIFGGSSAQLRRASTDSDLLERDQWAAGVLTDLFAENAAAGKDRLRAIVLYGELHLATKHLPNQLGRVSKAYLRKPLSHVCVHQNNDQLYWKFAQAGRIHETHAVRLRKQVYCVLSATPWAKLQSLVTWAEGGEAQPNLPGRPQSLPAWDDAFFDDEIEGESGGIDYLSVLRTYGDILAELLDVPPPSYESLSVRTIAEADFVSSLEREHQFSRRELRIVRDAVTSNQRMYIPRVNIAYLASASQNGAAELAAIHLLRARTRSTEILAEDPEDFFRLVLEAAFGFFGSLIINPRRKCDLPTDHKRRIRALARLGARAGRTQREELEARKLALALLRAAGDTGTQSLPSRLQDKLHDWMGPPPHAPVMLNASRFLGEILGQRLHHALLSGLITAETVKRICLARAEGDHRPYEERYIDLITAAAEAPLQPSKSDTL